MPEKTERSKDAIPQYLKGEGATTQIRRGNERGRMKRKRKKQALPPAPLMPHHTFARAKTNPSEYVMSERRRTTNENSVQRNRPAVRNANAAPHVSEGAGQVRGNTTSANGERQRMRRVRNKTGTAARTSHAAPLVCQGERRIKWKTNEPGATPIRVSILTKYINKINNTKKSNYTNNANKSNNSNNANNSKNANKSKNTNNAKKTNSTNNTNAHVETPTWKAKQSKAKENKA